MRYDELAPMLLNEMQQEQRKNATQAAEIRDLRQQQLRTQQQMAEMRAALSKLQAAGEYVVQR